MIDLGIVRPGTTLYVPFQTFSSDDPSASMTLTGLATTDIEIYKDGSTTQRASDSGYALLDTDGIDFDGITGIHGFSVDLADNTTAGFYAAGSQYWIVVSSVTVDAATINFIAATFRIGYPAAILNTTIATLSSQTSFTLTAGPAEDDALNGMEIVIHDVASAVQIGRAVILDYTGSTKTVTLAAGTTFTAAASDNVAIIGPSPLQPTTSGNKLDVSSGGEAGLDWANVGTPGSTVNLSATTVKTATDVETDTADIQTRLPAALTGDGNIKADTLRVSGTAQTAGDLAALITTVDDLLDTEVAAIKAKTDNLPSDPADASDVASSFSTVNSTLSTIAGYLDTEIAAIKAKTDQLTFGTANRVNSQVYGFEADSITNAAFDNATGKQVIRSGTLQSGAGYSATLDASASSTDDTYIGTWIYLTAGTGTGQCRMISAYNGTTKVATIISKSWATTPDNTTEYSILPAAYVYGAKEIYNDGIFPGSIAADAITASALATDAVTEIQSGLATASALSIVAGYIDTEVAAIKAKTDNLPSDPADASDIAALLTAIDDFVDTEIAAIKTVTDQLVAAQAEPSSVPAANATPLEKIAWLAMIARNKIEQTATTQVIKADNGTTTVGTSTLSDDGTTMTRGEFA